MTNEEFQAWAEVTKASESKWMLDEVQFYNHGTALLYTGGVSGKYIMVTIGGVAEMGTYEYAVPHIGDALFHVEKKVNVPDPAKTLEIIMAKLGMTDILGKFVWQKKVQS